MQNQKTLSRLLTAALVSLASVAAVSVQAAPPPADGTSQPAATMGGSATPGVPGEASSYADDVMITTKVKAALIEDKEVQAVKIDVKTTQGVVVMSGTVPTAAVGKRALQLASSVQGVKDVKSELKVKG